MTQPSGAWLEPPRRSAVDLCEQFVRNRAGNGLSEGEVGGIVAGQRSPWQDLNLRPAD
jgi:hypothetical protein